VVSVGIDCAIELDWLVEPLKDIASAWVALSGASSFAILLLVPVSAVLEMLASAPELTPSVVMPMLLAGELISAIAPGAVMFFVVALVSASPMALLMLLLFVSPTGLMPVMLLVPAASIVFAVAFSPAVSNVVAYALAAIFRISELYAILCWAADDGFKDSAFALLAAAISALDGMVRVPGAVSNVVPGKP